MNVHMSEQDITKNVLAIVCFGPATAGTGMRAGDYYQVTIDPNTCSPGGKYIRFGLYQGDEIQGWQRIDALTVVEILCDSDALMHAGAHLGYECTTDAKVSMMVID